MQLCLMIEGQEGVSWDEWVGLAHACEEHRIPTLFRSDHYQNLDGQHPERGALDAWATVCGLAALTSTLRLGTLVSPATFRHPSNLAKLATSADHISGGRIELGLGAGWHEREHAAYGFPFGSTGERMDVLEEQLQVVLGNWGDERFTFEGAHYRLDDLDAQPRPLQRPHPPLIMGATPDRAAPGWPRGTPMSTTPCTHPRPTCGTARQRIIEACSHAEREPIPFSIMTSLIAGRDTSELRDRARRLLERAGGDPDVDRFLAGPPPGWIVGTVEQVVEQLNRLREAGVSRIMCQQLLHDDLDAIALLGELAPRVA